MNLQPSTITPNQWQKVLKASYYSFGSGFVAGLTLAVTGALTGLADGHSFALTRALVTALIVGGVVGGFNSLAVTVKQLFTPGQ